jgi:hypothetical protein
MRLRPFLLPEVMAKYCDTRSLSHQFAPTAFTDCACIAWASAKAIGSAIILKETECAVSLRAIKGVAENQKSESAGGNASHRWYILRPMTPTLFLFRHATTALGL